MNHFPKIKIDPPAVIIGAARSGTNMLRNLLSELEPFATWPCDEINYIWRHGNREFETDEFTAEMANEKTVAYIRKQFARFAKDHPGKMVIEKTCANTLRCEFVQAVLPNAKFIHIIRDGRDAAASASLRWNAGLDIGYLMKKARYVPKTDVPYYALRYLGSHIYRLTAKKDRLSTWGPKFTGMQTAFEQNDLAVGCAIQWKSCVSKAIEQLGKLDQKKVMTVRYEAVTSDPAMWLNKICEFLDRDVAPVSIAELTDSVSKKSVGKWQKQLSELQVQQINEVAGDLLTKLGYVEP
ncbi:sulfotransferase family protein [Mariniblastus fucicola]|nr:sulfotransferase [Mariniblastus fucicola]